MITDFLITVLYNFVLLIVNLISLAPDVTISSALSNSLDQISPYYTSLDLIFPMATLLAILAFELVFEGSHLVYKLIKWAYTKIPGIS